MTDLIDESLKEEIDKVKADILPTIKKKKTRYSII